MRRRRGTKGASRPGSHGWLDFRYGFHAVLCPSIFQRSTGFAPASSPNEKFALRKNLCGVIMSQQTEDRRQIDGQALPSNDVGRPERPHRRWLGVAIALIAAAALLGSCIWSPVRD